MTRRFAHGPDPAGVRTDLFTVLPDLQDGTSTAPAKGCL